MSKMKNVIFLDMDGVLLDWVSAALPLLGLDPTDEKIQQAITKDYTAIDKLVGKDKVTEVMLKVGPEFWLGLKRFPWTDYLIEQVLESGLGEVAFLSKPGPWPEAYKGKVMWQLQNYPGCPLILCRHKGMVASPTSFLIDDDSEQLDYFHARGGIAYKWPCQFELLNNEAKWRHELDLLKFAMDATLVIEEKE